MGRNGTPAREARLRKAAMAKILDALRDGASIRKAAEAGGVSRHQIRLWRDAHPDFNEQFEDAYEAGTDQLEDEARRRGSEGWEEPVFFRGDECGTIRRYSDQLLLRTLEARRPERWRANARIEHAGDGGGAIEVDLKGLRDVLASRLDSLAERRATGS